MIGFAQDMNLLSLEPLLSLQVLCYSLCVFVISVGTNQYVDQSQWNSFPRESFHTKFVVVYVKGVQFSCNGYFIFIFKNCGFQIQRSPHVCILLQFLVVLEMVSVRWQNIINIMPLVCCRNYCPQKCSTHQPIFSSSVPTQSADLSELLEMHRCFLQYDIDLHRVGGIFFYVYLLLLWIRYHSRSYTILLTNCSLIDLLACFCSCMSIERFSHFHSPWFLNSHSTL